MMIRSLTISVFSYLSVFAVGLVRAGEPDFSEPIAAPVYEDPGADRWDIQFRPYVWAAGIEGTVGNNGVELPVDVGFTDILDVLKFTWSSSLEIRRTGSKWNFMLDTFYMEVEDDAPPVIDDIIFKQAIIDPMIGYRFREWNDGRSFVSLLGGLRWMYLDSEIESVFGKRQTSESWFDPHVGIRVKHYFNERLYCNVAADYGGFGINSDYVFEGLGGLGYHIRPNLTLDLYYRYFDIDYSNDGFVWDTQTSGVFLGVGFHF